MPLYLFLASSFNFLTSDQLFERVNLIHSLSKLNYKKYILKRKENILTGHIQDYPHHIAHLCISASYRHVYK